MQCPGGHSGRADVGVGGRQSQCPRPKLGQAAIIGGPANERGWKGDGIAVGIENGSARLHFVSDCRGRVKKSRLRALGLNSAPVEIHRSRAAAKVERGQLQHSSIEINGGRSSLADAQYIDVHQSSAQRNGAATTVTVENFSAGFNKRSAAHQKRAAVFYCDIAGGGHDTAVHRKSSIVYVKTAGPPRSPVIAYVQRPAGNNKAACRCLEVCDGACCARAGIKRQYTSAALGHGGARSKHRGDCGIGVCCQSGGRTIERNRAAGKRIVAGTRRVESDAVGGNRSYRNRPRRSACNAEDRGIRTGVSESNSGASREPVGADAVPSPAPVLCAGCDRIGVPCVYRSLG